MCAAVTFVTHNCYTERFEIGHAYMGRRNLFERIGEEAINESTYWFRAKKETIHLIGSEHKREKNNNRLNTNN